MSVLEEAARKLANRMAFRSGPKARAELAISFGTWIVNECIEAAERSLDKFHDRRAVAAAIRCDLLEHR